MTKEFDFLYDEAVDEYDERDACVPVAISLCTGFDLGLVLAMLKKNGREHRCPTYLRHTFKTLEEMGFLALELNTDQTFETYESKSLVSLQKELPKNGVYLIATHRHISCFKNGILHDWCFNKRMRIEGVWRLIDAN